MNTRPHNLARAMKVLSVGTRVRIVQLLRKKALCVNALAARLDVTQGAVSQHLRVMRDAGLVIDERRGYHVHYRLNPSTMNQWRAQINALLTLENEAKTERRSSCHKKIKTCTAAENRKT